MTCQKDDSLLKVIRRTPSPSRYPRQHTRRPRLIVKQRLIHISIDMAPAQRTANKSFSRADCQLVPECGASLDLEGIVIR